MLSFDPLGLAMVSVGCTPRPDASVGCSDVERQALEVSVDGEVAVVSDRNAGVVGPYQILVDQAELLTEYYDGDCYDGLPSYLRALIARSP